MAGTIDLRAARSIDFGPWGVITIVDRRVLVLDPRDGTSTPGRFPLCEDLAQSIAADYWMDRDAGTFLLLGHVGRAVHFLDALRRRLTIAAMLYRDDNEDPALLRQELVELRDAILIVYEGGIVCLDLDMRCRWKQDHDRMDWWFTGIADGVAWYHSDWEGVWGYALADGSRITKGDTT